MRTDSVRRVSGLLFEAIMLSLITNYSWNDGVSDNSRADSRFYIEASFIETIVACDYVTMAKKLLNPIAHLGEAWIDFVVPVTLRVNLLKTFFSNYDLNTFYISLRINAP